MNSGVRLALLFLLGLLVLDARGGGSGLNVIVVVNQNSSNSLQVANFYCEKRGVPPENVFRMTTWTGGNIQWTREEFETHLRNPLFAMLTERGLWGQAEYVLLSMDIPYRVGTVWSANSTTSALYYGYKEDSKPPEGLPAPCSLPDASSNSFAFSERAFLASRPGTNSLMTVMLPGRHYAEAAPVIERGLYSDGTYPTQRVILAKTTDAARSVRSVDFYNAMFEDRVSGAGGLVYTNSNSTDFGAIRGLQTGLWGFTLAPGSFLPGSLADTLTSFGGQLFDDHDQTTVLAFLAAGAAGSYGTVVEPCNYLEKFPDAMDFFYQQRGYSMAESYYMCVQNPHQGLLTGEPLSAPFAKPGAGQFLNLNENAILRGTVPISAQFSAATTDLPLTRVDLFLDGKFLQTVTNIPPTAGNRLSVTLDGVSVSATVPQASSLEATATLLASRINARTNQTRIVALQYGDRILLRSLNTNRIGGTVNISASADAGSGSRQTTFLKAGRTSFLDTPAYGTLTFTLSNNPAIGDWLFLEITKTNGVVVSMGVTNQVAGQTMATFAKGLFDMLNSSPSLEGDDAVHGEDFYPFASDRAVSLGLYANAAGWSAAEVRAKLSVSPGLLCTPSDETYFQENFSDLPPRAHLYLSEGLPNVFTSLSLDTTKFADGWHELSLVAYEGTSVRTQTRITRSVQFQNTTLVGNLTVANGLTNTPIGGALGILVQANRASAANIELVTTGGTISSSPTALPAQLTIPTATLGMGSHPVFAIITNAQGARFRTATTWVRVVDSPVVKLAGPPWILTWNAIPGTRYEVLSASNLESPFVPIGTVTATSATANFEIPGTLGTSALFRLSWVP